MINEACVGWAEQLAKELDECGYTLCWLLILVLSGFLSGSRCGPSVQPEQCIDSQHSSIKDRSSISVQSMDPT